MSQGELVPQGQEVATVQPTNLLQAITQASMNPALDIDKFERLLAMQERLEARQRETAFMEALAKLQAEVPLIHKGGKNNHTGSTYARREDIHVVLQPLLAKHGFSFSFDEEAKDIDKQEVTFAAKLSHKDGHFEVKRLTVPVDAAAKNSSGKPTRTGIQDMGSTASYAQRYLLKMHLNMAETDEDTDGNSTEKITEGDAFKLKVGIADAKMEMARFLVFMRVGALEEILVSDLKKAWNCIDVRKRELNAAKPTK